MSQIATTTTLESFFFEELERAAEERGTGLEEDVSAYVVHLLASFARKTNVAGRTAAPLALQYMAARRNGRGALREVGDRALYIAGAVPGSLDRSAVDVDYVTSIGSSAYQEVGAGMPTLRVFERLAESFRRAATLIGAICTRDDGSDVLATFERWRRNKNPTDASRLAARGVLLDLDGNAH